MSFKALATCFVRLLILDFSFQASFSRVTYVIFALFFKSFRKKSVSQMMSLLEADKPSRARLGFYKNLLYDVLSRKLPY